MKRMLIDAAHPEETRVVILDGNRIDDFEAETQGKQQLKGNIYIGHVSRVEPSLQAAFITYGGNRNGFLAFAEVHPQFFALKEDEKAELLAEMAQQAARRRGADAELDDTPEASAPGTATELTDTAETSPLADEDAAAARKAAAMAVAEQDGTEGNQKPGRQGRRGRAPKAPQRVESRTRPKRIEASTAVDAPIAPESAEPTESAAEAPAKGGRRHGRTPRNARHAGGSNPVSTNAPETAPRHSAPIHRRYRIQDVLKEGQKILVQVVKEERGSKGAALTTYFSMPGRYTVLMPNTPYAGGISRKITDPTERRQLRDVYAELQVPDTMGLIIRTAGVGQPIDHIKRDYANLTNLWQHIQQEFEANQDIQCLHEDGSVIIRALRDMMSDDIEEITISGSRAYKMAKDYAKNLMPEVAALIKQHKSESPLFNEAGVEQKLNHLHHTRVTLPSGGYLVINPTEALVSVDINSGRATQERNIEETAVKTNLEACDELARQIRLRDLAGLIVVDFIDMEDTRNVRKVENAMRKALKRDRARIQTGSISEFGLMEISRQRLRPSFGESHFIACPHCQGSGLIHSPATSALMVLRRLEHDDIQGADRVIVTSSTNMVIWILNHKRDVIRSLEERFKYQLQFRADDTLVAPDHRIELVRIKADGTESVHTLEVLLREQPELPPELRQKHSRPPREREESRDHRHESRHEARNDKPTRHGKPENKPEAKPTEAKAESHAEAKKSDNKATKPKAENKEAPKAPKPNQPVADQPLAVQRVAAETADAAPVIAPPKRSFALKKQADTDSADAPIAVARITTESTSTPAEAPITRSGKKEKDTKAKSGIISRLIGL